MRMKGNHLTKEEQDVIILAAKPLGGKHLNNFEIAQQLHMSTSKVKMLIHQSCSKLGAHNRIEAIAFALRRGEVKLNDIYTISELAEFWSSLCPGDSSMIARLACEGFGYGQSPGKDDLIIHTDIKQDTMLTKCERDILTLVGRGLANREIANTLYLSIDTVGKFLYRAYTKLGVCKRADAALMAIRMGEISFGEMYSFNELLEFLVPLETDSIDKMSRKLKQKLGIEPVLKGC